MKMQHDAGDIARMLAGRVNELVAELLPAGKRDGAEWRCGSLAGEPGRSLAVHLGGTRAGVWSDFASGERGDALDLVAAVLYRGDRRAALVWARRWLGLGDSVPPPRQTPAPPVHAAEPAKVDREAEARRGAAKRLFLAAQAELRGTGAEGYLAGRGISLAELGRQPKCLRFHPALHNRESGKKWPAMVAAITGADGEHVATHRTWLCQNEAGEWTKAPLRDAKMTLGGYAGGSIRLWRGASGLPLAKAMQGELVVIGEGLETCLSIVLALPELRVICAVSLANMGAIKLPPAVSMVVLACDNDGDNPAAARALQRAIDYFAAEGREVRLARPDGVKDFNDLLTGAES